MRLGKAVVGVRAGAFGDDEQVNMVLQVRPHVGLVEHHRNAKVAQMIGRANARQLQQARRPDRACRQDHLASPQHALACQLHPRGAALVDHNAQHLRTCLHCQVRAAFSRAQIGH